jgi:hypothetical protein
MERREAVPDRADDDVACIQSCEHAEDDDADILTRVVQADSTWPPDGNSA